MLASLLDPAAFRERRASEWARAREYWLSAPLRHVSDIGPAIIGRVLELLEAAPHSSGVVDAACGSGWLLNGLRDRGSNSRYIGLDMEPEFLRRVREIASARGNAEAYFADLETELSLPVPPVSVVVSAFTLFELADLSTATRNLTRLLAQDGTTLVVTIDKTYLMLAAADGDWDRFMTILREYTALPGTRFFFQQIDLGDGASRDLAYASVLYSTEDYVAAFRAAGLEMTDYREIPATDRPIPKIYQLLEFRHADPGLART
jgi:SAM-dependent methyltransferase